MTLAYAASKIRRALMMVLADGTAVYKRWMSTSALGMMACSDRAKHILRDELFLSIFARYKKFMSCCARKVQRLELMAAGAPGLGPAWASTWAGPS